MLIGGEGSKGEKRERGREGREDGRRSEGVLVVAGEKQRVPPTSINRSRNLSIL